MIRWPALIIVSLLATSAGAQKAPKQVATETRKDGSKVVTLSIVGDREQPTVLYIVPWKRSPRDEVLISPMPALQPMLEPVDPEVQGHEADYRAHLEKMRP